ncbi:Protein ltv1 [Malassezia equina]|uniref:Protein ltv1 n=1 Tax=Malassezia equina TaxID=1381935 RepID=A0AAF0EAZ5_9BASI|nr:Protein ltv1 [Malassezia equina]
MAPKSIWRQPNAVHFQVVHRSQRDVRKDDPEASAHVLKPYEPPNRTKGKSRADLEQDDPALVDGRDGAPVRSNVGEAAMYGIYYDDTEYDYMQHLRAIPDAENSRRGGVDEEDDTEAVWVPSAVQPKERAPRFALKEDEQAPAGDKPGLLLPASVFASQEAPLDLAYAGETHGLQPDMDPHLRQTLEALDDDAFVADDADDDFFADIVQDGAWDGRRTGDDAWRDAAPEGDSIWLDPLQRAMQEREAAGGDEAALSLEARIALFKAQAQAPGSDDEDNDTLGDLPPMPTHRARPAGSVSSTGSALGRKGAPGALARRAASTRAGSVGGGSTVWSMTSSSMARNQQLTELDARFDQVIRAYGGRATGDPELDALHGAFEQGPSEDEDEEEELDHETAERLTREDLDAILDDFLEHHEVIAGQLKPTLGDRSTTADEKLTMLREALGEARITTVDDEDHEALTPASENPFLNPDVLRADREQWDVETIQTTKTNLENHPRTIAAAESVITRGTGASTTLGRLPRSLADPGTRLPKIRIHPRTGLPQVVGYTSAPKPSQSHKAAPDMASDDASSTPDVTASRPVRAPVKRDRNESHDARRARKEAQKMEKQQRRQEKAAAKQAYADEHKRQLHASRRQAEARGGGAALHLA